MANGIRTGGPCGFNKGCSLKFRVGSWVQQTPEEGQRKRCGNNNKDEDNSPKTLNDKNHQALSQKFRQVMLYEFQLGYNTMDVTKNICCVKGAGTVDPSTVTRWLKQFCLSCKNLNKQANSWRPKTVYFEAVNQTLETNEVNSTQRVLSMLGIS